MGANTFSESSNLSNVADAFRELTERSRYESGASYSGEIGMKSEYVVIQRTPMLPADASALAERLIDSADSRVDDKYGPAGAIPLGTDGKTITGWLFFGWASS